MRTIRRSSQRISRLEILFGRQFYHWELRLLIWHGPYKVDQALPGNAYMLEELDGVKFPVAVNGQHLKKYFPSMWEGE